MEPFFDILEGKIYPKVVLREDAWDFYVASHQIKHKDILWKLIYDLADAGYVLEGDIKVIHWDWIKSLAVKRLQRN